MVRAAVQTGPRTIEMREFPRPQTGADDGLLRVEANGICGSDVEIYRGHMGMNPDPFVPGHEPLGIIEEVGERAAERWGVQVGDRVALEVIVPCRACDDCLTGRYQSCRYRKYGHGVDRHRRRAEPLGRLRRVPLPVTGHGAAQDRQEPACRDRGDVQPARRRRPLGRPTSAGSGSATRVLVLGAGQRGLAAVIAAQGSRRRHDHRDRARMPTRTSWRWPASSAPTTRCPWSTANEAPRRGRGRVARSPSGRARTSRWR